MLYLTWTWLLDTAVFCLSGYITRHEDELSHLVQKVRDEGEEAWELWIVYMLRCVEETSRITLELIEGSRVWMATVKYRIRNELPRMYSQDLLDNLFCHPYTTISFVQKEFGIILQTVEKYFYLLENRVMLVKRQDWRKKLLY